MDVMTGYKTPKDADFSFHFGEKYSKSKGKRSFSIFHSKEFRKVRTCNENITNNKQYTNSQHPNG